MIFGLFKPKNLFSLGAAALGAFFGPQAQAAAHKIGGLIGINSQPLNISNLYSTPPLNPNSNGAGKAKESERRDERQFEIATLNKPNTNSLVGRINT